MRVVTTLLPVKINSRIAWVLRGRRVALIFALKTLLTRPNFDQRAVHAEMLIRQQIVGTRLFQHLHEELLGDVAIQQPLAILAEHCGDPHWLVHIQTHEPAEQQIVFQLLHQHSLTANRVQDLQ
jgi:hypothetical protein